MEKSLSEVLNGQVGNYLLPFYWQHGESAELLEEGMEKIHDSGIGAVCVESRPHPDFVGDGWWRDLDIIMKKAKELDMRVWVLDDAHFPSGYCNGKVTEDSPYRKRYLDHYCVDLVGPLKGCSVMVKLMPGERYVGAVIGKRDRKDPLRLTEIVDISDRMQDDRIYVDVPDGTWCVMVMKITDKGTGRKNYINSIEKESVRFFIDTVYEAHYAHYAEDFGKTFAGFFSDEPEIGNCLGEYRFDAYVGQKEMRLPWSPVVEERLKSLWGERFETNLASLWMKTDEEPDNLAYTGLIRSQFMDLISEQYGKNFCGQIGDWCREHGVEYIGHVIEDGGTHAHVGLGTGHFFRALWGEDMSGIDVVLQQIRPGLDDCPFYSIGGTSFYDGELFHYGLAKMGVSLGQLDPKKKGRTMCEVFGAYGWSEGLKLMKWLMDHMLVNGVNYFVPHAFTMKAFPDPDCPPHFYARGNNPQYPYFKDLMEYTNRVSHLIQDGLHVANVGVLYTAEQEWMGKFRPFEKDARVLTRNQIDFEVVPTEHLLSVECDPDGYVFGQKKLSALVVPGSDFIGEALAQWINSAIAKGLTVVFSQRVPKILCSDGSTKEEPSWSELAAAEEELPNLLAKQRRIQTADYEPWLRFYEYRRGNSTYILYFNESPSQTIETVIEYPADLISGQFVCMYDPWTNELKMASPVENTSESGYSLCLTPYEMQIVYIGEIEDSAVSEMKKNPLASRSLMDLTLGEWKLSVQNAIRKEDGSLEDWKDVSFQPILGDACAPGKLSGLTGTFRYETEFNLDSIPGGHVELSLGEVYETAAVTINGKKAGVRVAPPYRFDVSEFVKAGANCLEVSVINTLGEHERDRFSMTMPLEPSGLIGPVELLAD